MRPRLRELGISLGRLPPGRDNAITDVPGGLVGHTTLIRDTPRLARTGVTMVVPRDTESGTATPSPGTTSSTATER